MKMCFDCVGEVVYTNSFSLAKVDSGRGKALILTSDIGEHTLGVYNSDKEVEIAMKDVVYKIDEVLGGENTDKVVHIYARKSYVTNIKLYDTTVQNAGLKKIFLI